MIYVRQDGSEIEINDAPANVAKAVELGWEPKGEDEPKKQKRTRRTKEEMERDAAEKKGEDKSALLDTEL